MGGNHFANGRVYERLYRWGTTPKVSLFVGAAEDSDVSGVVITVPAGGWEDKSGNRNTASSNSLYLAHNWKVSVADANAEEGTNETIDFEVTLNARDDCKTVTVDWATADGTAIAGEDYTAANGTLTFGPGETSKTVKVVIIDDAIEDSGETFTLQLSNASGMALEDGEATGTIFNHESPFSSVPQVSGVAQVGNTLDVSFAEAPNGALTYQWLRGTEVIVGATASTYASTEADVGTQLSVRVESGGESLTSAATTPVWPAPVNPPLADGEEELLSATMTLGWHNFPLWNAGYGRVLGVSFGEMDDTAFEDGGATHGVDVFTVNSMGRFILATGSTLPDAAGLVAYWNGYKISELGAKTSSGGVPLLVGRTPQPNAEYSRYKDGASDGVRVAVSLRRTSVTAQDALTAEFRGLPDEHENNAFTFELRLSEEFGLSYLTLQNHALTVTNGELTRVARAEQGKNQIWNVTVTPDDDRDVTIALAETTDCAAAGAICTEDARPLSAAVSTIVPQSVPATTTQPEKTPLTAEIMNVPAEHDGSSQVTLRLAFSEEPHEYSYKTLRDHTLSIRQGQSSLTPSVRRLASGSSRR